MVKGEAGFNHIQYKGHTLDADTFSSVETISVDHFYRGTYQTMVDGTRGEHACLQMGYWCWKQARTSPVDVYRYLIKKWRRAHATNPTSN